MAKKLFQKGQSGNPGGRPKLPEEVKLARALNQNQLELTVNKYIAMDRNELKERLADPTTPTLELMIGSIIHKAVSGGDHTRLNFILDRLIGKVMEKVKLELPVPTIIKLANGESLVLGAKPGTKREE